MIVSTTFFVGCAKLQNSEVIFWEKEFILIARNSSRINESLQNQDTL